MIDNLFSASTTEALSANQGRLLNERIDALERRPVDNWVTAVNNKPIHVSASTPYSSRTITMVCVNITDSAVIPYAYRKIKLLLNITFAAYNAASSNSWFGDEDISSDRIIIESAGMYNCVNNITGAIEITNAGSSYNIGGGIITGALQNPVAVGLSVTSHYNGGVDISASGSYTIMTTT